MSEIGAKECKTNVRQARRQICLRFGRILAPLLLFGLGACSSDGHLCILGYTTKPNYDTNIHTVYVPIFKNNTFRKDLEFELTKAVVREIEAKTPYKVVSDPCRADTELTGTIISLNKLILNRTQLNEVREAETVLSVEVTWRDLRTGEILSKPRAGQTAPPPPPPPNPATGAPPPLPTVLIQSEAGFIEELGESITTAQKKNVDRLAIQIVSMMESPW
jgi:hypothetical protein